MSATRIGLGAALLAAVLVVVPATTPGVPAAAAPACTRWSTVPTPPRAIPGSHHLEDVDFASSTDGWAVGWRPAGIGPFPSEGTRTLIEHSSGGAWSVFDGPSIDDAAGAHQNVLMAVTAIGVQDAWAVGWTTLSGTLRPLLVQWDGGEWAAVDAPEDAPDAALYDVSSTGPDDVWAVGHGFTLHYDGDEWSTIAHPVANAILRGVTAIADDDVWAVGWSSATSKLVVEHWDGAEWTQDTSVPDFPGSSVSSSLADVDASAPDDVWAAGISAGGPFAVHWDGDGWTVSMLPTGGGAFDDAVPEAVVVEGPGNAWVMGQYTVGPSSGDTRPLVEHWNGTSWSFESTPVPSPTVWDLALDGATLAPGGQVWSVGGDELNSLAMRRCADHVLYEPRVPVRVLETRAAAPGGQRGYSGPKPPAGHVIQLDVSTPASGVPEDADAVVLNVTATETAAAGWVTVWPCGSAFPNASSLNTVAGQTVANLVVADVGVGGTVCLYTRTASHFVADVNGWFPGGSEYSPQVPVRVLETRAAAPGGQQGYSGPKPPAGHVIQLDVSTPTSGVSPTAEAVVLNLTATETAAAGWVTVWPCGAAFPNASNVNTAGGRTVANLVVAQVGENGMVCLYTRTASHLVADVNGWFEGGGAYQPRIPVRVLETRDAAPGGQRGYAGAKPPAGHVIQLDVVTPASGVPATAEAVVLNLTATETAAAGWVTVWPCGAAFPNASSLNTMGGQTVANLVIAPVGVDGTVCLYTRTATHLIADVNGWM